MTGRRLMSSFQDGAFSGGVLVADAGLAVDLALVLAVDCSSSIDAGDFRIQMQGIAAALRHPEVAKAIAAGEHQRIVLSLVLWSNAKVQMIALPWRLLANPVDLEIAAGQVEAVQRNLPGGGTGLAAAIVFSTALLSALPIPAKRYTIDVSGDGEDNEGGNAGAARDLAVARGATINGLPIIDGSSSITRYYSAQVIGGPGAFIEQAETIMSFRDTILRKLLREIGRPVS
jgi:Protein of unknown function (DUF1194)